mmetsp:Transcript_74132/g.241063  ORF Transcript_74132/g.241063 Transcript_74132/m.241063 type:complete len:246 (-) Transcript_74132:763-1500(-)
MGSDPRGAPAFEPWRYSEVAQDRRGSAEGKWKGWWLRRGKVRGAAVHGGAGPPRGWGSKRRGPRCRPRFQRWTGCWSGPRPRRSPERLRLDTSADGASRRRARGRRAACGRLWGRQRVRWRRVGRRRRWSGPLAPRRPGPRCGALQRRQRRHAGLRTAVAGEHGEAEPAQRAGRRGDVVAGRAHMLGLAEPHAARGPRGCDVARHWGHTWSVLGSIAHPRHLRGAVPDEHVLVQRRLGGSRPVLG